MCEAFRMQNRSGMFKWWFVKKITIKCLIYFLTMKIEHAKLGSFDTRIGEWASARGKPCNSRRLCDLTFSYNTSVLKITNVNYCFIGVLVVTMIMVRPTEGGFFQILHFICILSMYGGSWPFISWWYPSFLFSYMILNAMKFKLHCIGIARCHNVSYYEPKNFQQSVLF